MRKGLRWRPPLRSIQQSCLASMAPRAVSANFHTYGAPCSCPFRLAFHSQHLVPPEVMLQTPLSSTQPPPRTGGRQLSLGCTGPAPTDHLWQPHLIPGRSLSVPADFPTMRVFFFPVRGPPSTFSFLPKLLVPFVASLVFLSFFHPTRFQGDFSYPFRCPMSSTNVQQGLCENCSIKVYS